MTIAAEMLLTLPIQRPLGRYEGARYEGASSRPNLAITTPRPPRPEPKMEPEVVAAAVKPLSPSMANLAPRQYFFSWHLSGGNLCLHPSAQAEPPLPVNGPCRLTLHLHLPIPPEWDTNMRNAALMGTARPLPEPDAALLGGALLKALQGMVIHETYQVVAFSLTRHYSLRPRLEIVAQPLGE